MLYRNMAPPAQERVRDLRPHGLLHWLRLAGVALTVFWPVLPSPPWW
jgi:hypothetical protein